MSNNSSVPAAAAAGSCPHQEVHRANMAVSYLFLATLPVSLLLNGVAAWVSLHLRATSTFMVYLKHLLAADLLMTLTLPPMAVSMLPGASVQLRTFACRYSDVVFYCSLYTSISLMGLISLDRFFKIVRPCGKLLGQSLAFSAASSTCVWVLLFGCTALPTMILTDRAPVNITGPFCMSLKGPAGRTLHKYVVVFMEVLFWVVCVLVVFCYACITLRVLQSFRKSRSGNSDRKWKTKLRVFLILLVFFVCFVPLHLMRIPSSSGSFDMDVCSESWMTVAYHLFLWLSITNTCLDPILYIYLCRDFRDKLVAMMKERGFCTGLLLRGKRGDFQLESHQLLTVS